MRCYYLMPEFIILLLYCILQYFDSYNKLRMWLPKKIPDQHFLQSWVGRWAKSCTRKILFFMWEPTLTKHTWFHLSRYALNSDEKNIYIILHLIHKLYKAVIFLTLNANNKVTKGGGPPPPPPIYASAVKHRAHTGVWAATVTASSFTTITHFLSHLLRPKHTY